MSSDYTYDENGQLWPLFAFTLTTIVTLPLTYVLLTKTTDPVSLFPRIQAGDYKIKHEDLVAAAKSKERRKNRRLGLTLLVVGGWAVIGYMLYLIHYTEAPESKRLWNPYDILGISESATEKTIKSSFKKLSLKFHPDKIRPDPAKNETIEDLNSRYVEISKAYQSLTDEDVRKNYMMYGHPDGKQGFSIGIALPRLMISDGNGKYVILFYATIFGVILPYMVGTWWYGTQRKSKEGTLLESANSLFREYDGEMNTGSVVTSLSVGREFKTLESTSKDIDSSAIESRILAKGETSACAAGLSPKDQEKLEHLDIGPQRKALALLWAYLGRVELGDAALDKAKFEVAPLAHSLIKSSTAVALAYGNTIPILSSYYASQRLMQAIPPNASPLLQLPYFTPRIARAAEGSAHSPLTVQRFLTMSDSRRRQLVIGKDLLSESQYETSISVAKQIPYLQVAKAFFKVTGERFIIPSSLVTLVVKGRVIPPGTENVPEINESDLLDVDPAEDDLDAILGRKNKRSTDSSGKPILVTGEDEPVLPPLAFAPYFGRNHSPRWHVFLTDSKQGKMAVPPFTFTTFDQPILEKDGKTPTAKMQTLKAQFAAPPQAGHYTFVMHVVCDSYIGFDTKMEVTLVVEDANKAAEMGAEDDISEPEEDSIAGIMSAAKGETVARPKKMISKDESDDESGTDEEDDSTSETNTDTDEE